MTKLVVIEKDNVYKFYNGRNRVAKVQSLEPLPPYWLEFYRTDHKRLLQDLVNTPVDPEFA